MFFDFITNNYHVILLVIIGIIMMSISENDGTHQVFAGSGIIISGIILAILSFMYGKKHYI